MITLTLFGRTGRSFTGQSACGIFLLLILTVPVRVKTQCPACTSQSIKTVNITTGDCISCFPCLRCDNGHISSVPCGSTVPFGTDIKCVLIQSDPVVATNTSTQTGHLTPILLTTSSSAKFIVTPVASVTGPSVIPSTSSTAPVSSSIKYGSMTTEKPRSEALPGFGNYTEWKKNTLTYVLCAACLLITFIAIIWKISKLKNKQLQQRPVLTGRTTTSGVQPQPNASPSQGNEVQQQPVNPADRTFTPLAQPWSCVSHSETCNINWATNSVAFSRYPHSGISKVEESNLMFQPEGDISSTLDKTFDNPLYDSPHFKLPDPPSQPEGATKDSVLNSATFINTPSVYMVNVVQPNTQLVPPVSSLVNIERIGPNTDGLEQGRPVNWSALLQEEKYNTKILEMPFPLLYKICLTLDIQAADGNDVRMLAEKLGISVGDLALLKQAAITQHNSITYVVLSKKSSLAVGDFVDIMREIERDDIVSLINN